MFFYLFFSQVYGFDREKVATVANNYITSLQGFSRGGENSKLFFGNLILLFTENDVHQNDLFNKNIDSELMIYLSDIQSEFSFQVGFEFYDDKVLDCSYFLNSDEFALVTFSKKITYQNEIKKLDFLLLINVNDPNKYLVNSVFFTKSEKNNISQSCTLPKEENSTAKFERELLEQANKYYKQRNYILSLRAFEEVLMLNNKNTLAIDGIKSCKHLIKSKQYIEEINSLIKNNAYSRAISRLEDLKKQKLKYDYEWFTAQKKLCKIELLKQKAIILIKAADYNFNNKMYSVAIQQYQESLQYNFKTVYIQSQINKCKQGDPNFVRKQLQIAFKKSNKSKSKEDWLFTFKIFTKYENSSLLTGDNYHFMCMMMLGNNFRKIGKPLGYSKNETYHLAKKYFYKARNLGNDVSFLENHVFTKNINKN